MITNFTNNKNVNKLLEMVLNQLIDPSGTYYNTSESEIKKCMDSIMTNKVAVLYTDGVVGKGRQFDVVLEHFALGSGGYLSNWDAEQTTDTALVIRGVGGGSQRAIKHCWSTNRTFYAVDTGYFGNSKHKTWHRVTKNNLQTSSPFIERPSDRLNKFDWKPRKIRSGSKILICPPSEKVMKLWDQPGPDEWTAMVIAELKKHTDRPIEIRMKPTRGERVTTNTIEDALRDDVYCLLTYNSIAATEALMNGRPAMALGPNAASSLCRTRIEDVENLYIPTVDEIYNFAKHLSYCQFTIEEFVSGYAWGVVNEGS
jgi:hypothetical protein